MARPFVIEPHFRLQEWVAEEKQLLTWVAARGELFCNDWPIGQRGIRQEVLITYESTA